jgi:hypothetical protein
MGGGVYGGEHVWGRLEGVVVSLTGFLSAFVVVIYHAWGALVEPWFEMGPERWMGARWVVDTWVTTS